ncbi:hypothetical protein EYF80_061626 [Liparis tanakae]|uniref:Uncharacterized protein n=1 Tax=Liparis tanakae TaxID=230148 RepID=A0A4Z2EHE2_9TELE|nr:hypothetical protein EYF80_061626 [Liparis tanakae]
MVTGHGKLGPGYGELQSAGTATAHGKLKLTGTRGAGTGTGRAGISDGTGKAGTDDWTGRAGTGDGTGKAGTDDWTRRAGTGDRSLGIYWLGRRDTGNQSRLGRGKWETGRRKE